MGGINMLFIPWERASSTLSISLFYDSMRGVGGEGGGGGGGGSTQFGGGKSSVPLH